MSLARGARGIEVEYEYDTAHGAGRSGRRLYRTLENLQFTRERQNRQIVLKQMAATESICECAHYAGPSVDQKSVSFWAF